ncbi:hypothetical protein TVAG_018470 [Trichomonas vaginalis G3]|uniref:Uncharacterized protein n=1 Tax=Trichomonas vaginalis (strain ATCC PRA-98 / G3) TaxID=412133 RepID=A2F9Y3_TRIV3|nr:hypothetical protein TVAGG3_0506380 [Trichomonas vaginalis G3]EAX98311.1 hypothetical protein TVAG_018470 [Trichomonas vaginalis G3]KAI5517453.1 hypothetical protein TVAGG3_0506380 [Trichomonas vaginalis G3]|eukprot:XP_001311241.1 hypothetical protein [Trichomonas vaginalis G3]
MFSLEELEKVQLIICCILAIFAEILYIMTCSSIHSKISILDSKSHLKFTEFKHKVPSYNYTNAWYKNQYSNYFTYRDYSKCPSCNYPNRTTSPIKSTPSDVILVYAIKGVKNLILFIRTLRHTGSQASVFLFVDTEAYNTINAETKEVLDKCGMNIIDMGKFPEFDIFSAFSMGFVAMHNFLLSNQKYIRNVLIVDLYDIIFQSDPFTHSGHMEKLEFVSQMNFYNSSDTDREWISFYRDFDPKWNDSLIINSGQLIGSCYNVLQFLDLYLEFFDPSDYYSVRTTDQAFFNLLFLTKKIDERKIPYIIYKYDAYSRIIVTLGLEPRERKLGYVRKYKMKEYVPIIHQYYKVPDLIYSILDSCKRETNRWINYTSGFTDEDIETYEKGIRLYI